MKGLLLGLLLASGSQDLTGQLWDALESGSASLESEWRFHGLVDASCALEVAGVATQASGAALDLDCASDATLLGSVETRMPAQPWRQRRVTFSVEMRADESLDASLWIKVRRNQQMLLSDDDTEQRFMELPSADGWVVRTLTLPVDMQATELGFGIRVQGAGDLQLRHVRITVSTPGSMTPQVVQWLDTALDVMRAYTHDRSDLNWRVLEPQARIFASGAQTPAEAYPVMRYLLSVLGDRQNMLLTPEMARMLGDASGADANAPLRSFTLPDGARLLLARTPSRTETRIAAR